MIQCGKCGKQHEDFGRAVGQWAARGCRCSACGEPITNATSQLLASRLRNFRRPTGQNEASIVIRLRRLEMAGELIATEARELLAELSEPIEPAQRNQPPTEDENQCEKPPA